MQIQTRKLNWKERAKDTNSKSSGIPVSIMEVFVKEEKHDLLLCWFSPLVSPEYFQSPKFSEALITFKIQSIS
jgi:replication initiation and membrane attachment protein DnaB